jgi:hypothetical protein
MKERNGGVTRLVAPNRVICGDRVRHDPWIFMRAKSAGRVSVVSDTAQLPWFWSGLGVVSGLGPGLTR